MNFLIRKIKSIIEKFGPGFFIIGYVVGTGSVTSMVVSGANFGLTLSWLLLLSCLFTYFLLIAIGKLTIISGNTLMYNFRKTFGKPVTLFIIVALLISIISSCVGIMGILADVVVEWFKINTNTSIISRPLVAAFFILILIGLFWSGKHKRFINIMSFLVALMALSFVITSFMVVFETSESFTAFFPSTQIEGNTGLVVAGIVGTTMAGVCLSSRSILVQEQGWDEDDLKHENKDAKNSMSLTFIISLAIMISATGTLYFKGIKVDQPTDMMYALGPWAGDFALTLFTLGIVGAGLSSIFPNLLLFPWLIADYSNQSRNMKRPLFKAIVIAIALTTLIIPTLGGKPVWILIASQALSPLIMPLITLFLIILLNEKEIMGKHKSKPAMNFILIITFLFNCYVMYIAWNGFINFLSPA